MQILIVEDDFICRKVLQKMLTPYGNCDIAVNGKEAIEAYRIAMDEGDPYDLVCLDILMPEMSGQEALEQIRKIEDTLGIQGLDRTKVIMTTGLGGSRNILEAFDAQCEAYLTKPIKREELLEQLEYLGLVEVSK